MPTYRVYYAEREPKDREFDPMRRGPILPRSHEYFKETEWEEEVDAPSVPAALDAFFKEHVRDNSELMWADENGESHPVTGLEYEPGRTYIWIENGNLMQFQGVDEATPGLVTCPLCDGAGEVDEEIADEFITEHESDGEEGW